MSNKQQAPPLRREELMPQLVTETDGFTALQYLRQREKAPKIWELEQGGARKLPGTPAALADVYSALWSTEPSVKPADQVRPDRRYWQGLLGQTLTTSAFQELHATTEGSSLLSFVGTVEAGTTILGLVPKEDAKKLGDLSQAAEQAEELEQAADEAQAEADAMQALAEQMMAGSGQGGQSGQPSGSESSGSSQLTASQAQALANKLAEQWAEAQTKADVARAKADATKAKVEAQADALLGKPGSAEAEQKRRELTRLGIGAVQKVAPKVQELASTIAAWGLEEAELSRMAIPEALGLVEKMRRSDALKKFASILGRMRAIASKKARSKVKGEGQRVPRTETGRDVRRAYVSELVALANPATRVQVLTRWARGELRLRGEEAKKPLGEGDLIVCEDGSGSMDGEKQQWAKAMVLSLAYYAKLRRRSFGWIMYDSFVQIAKTFLKGQLSAKDLLEITEARAGGGTDFERPLREAVEMIEKGGLKRADIVFVTDGDCAVSTEFLEWFRGKKKQLEFNVITVLCDTGGHVSDVTVKQFSDRVERASSFTADEAEAKVFSHL